MDFITIQCLQWTACLCSPLMGKLRLGPSRFHGWHLATCYLVSSPFKPIATVAATFLLIIVTMKQSSSTTHLKLETNAMDGEQSQKPGSICFETMIESYVDVHAILKKWNSYCFASRHYQRLPSNLAESFEDLNFHGME